MAAGEPLLFNYFRSIFYWALFDNLEGLPASSLWAIQTLISDCRGTPNRDDFWSMGSIIHDGKPLKPERTRSAVTVTFVISPLVSQSTHDTTVVDLNGLLALEIYLEP